MLLLLPHDVIVLVLAHCDPPAWAALSRANRHLYGLLQSPHVWKALYESHWPVAPLERSLVEDLIVFRDYDRAGPSSWTSFWKARTIW